MTTISGAVTVGEYPDEIPDGYKDEVWVQQGSQEDEVNLCDERLAPRLAVSHMAGDLVWRRHIEERVIAIASQRGTQAYLIDLAAWRILRRIDLRRDEDSYWNRTEILATPDESRCVLLSDTRIHVVTWRGVLLYIRRIETTDQFVSLGNDSITLMDEPNGGLIFTMPFLRNLPSLTT